MNRLFGMAGEAHGAVSACTQLKMKELKLQVTVLTQQIG